MVHLLHGQGVRDHASFYHVSDFRALRCMNFSSLRVLDPVMPEVENISGDVD